MPDDQPNQKYLVDHLFRTRDVHLIAGPSRAGKTTLALQILDSWSRGEAVFERPSHPLPAVYMACDRPAESLREHMECLDMDPEAHPHDSMADHTAEGERTVDKALGIARKTLPKMRVLFLDGFETLCAGRITEHRDVTKFMLTTAALCRKENITIIGCVPAVKSKENERYSAPQDRTLGSVAWMKLSDMAILIEPVAPKNPEDANRIVTLLPHRGATRSFAYAFDGPRLVRRAEVTLLPPMDAWLQNAPRQTPIPAKQLVEAGQALGIVRWKLYEWIKTQVDLGTMTRTDYGEYQIVGPVGGETAPN